MIIEIKIPSPGESITEVELASWFVKNGDTVNRDQELGEVESEKATLPLIAEQAGMVEILVEAGSTIEVGTVVCKIDTSVKAKESDKTSSTSTESISKKPEKPKEQGSTAKDKASEDPLVSTDNKHVKLTPLAKKMMQEEGFSLEDILNGLRKISSSDVQAVKDLATDPGSSNFTRQTASRNVERTPMSQLRKKISERLVAVKNDTAMLTTFNEADMSEVTALRKKYQDKFLEKHGVKLGFMSFFTKAVTVALQQFPNVNSYLDEDFIVSPDYCDIGIAVQTEKGLMVPVLRNTETLSLAEIEKQILDIAGRARKNRIGMDELTGGTFTITNGGVFGSMLSTPILNPPQSAILGMHNILERPIAVNGKVEIRPMMYLALSYDHRVIDGRDSVGFLKTVKEYIENPHAMLFAENSADTLLLGL